MPTSIIEEDIEQILSAPLPWERFYGKTALITGASGFLASYIVYTLTRLNDRKARAAGAPCRILALARNPARAAARLARLGDRDDVTVIPRDVAAPIEPDAAAFDGPIDFIIHAASQASPKYFLVDPVGTLLANTAGTQHLLELARRKASEGFLFLSSGEVYGQPTRIPMAEADYGYLDPATVRACYAEGKRIGETMCVAWAHQHGVPTRIVRPFHTYGPGVDLDDGRVFSDFVADVVQGRDLVIKSDGSARRPFCYIADAVEGFLTVLLNGENATPYNIGNEDAEVSILELADILVDLFPEKRLKRILAPQRQSSSYAKSPISRNCPDTTRARALGWAPRTSIQDGFRRTILSFA